MDKLLFELREPTEWMNIPEHFSFSSLKAIGLCPRRYQLLHSRWGEYARFPERPNVAAIEGQIVHELIERLTRALGRRGLPPLGSPGFQEAIGEVQFWERMSTQVDGWNERLAAGPGGLGPRRLPTSARELTNQAIRLIREQYKAGESAGEGPPFERGGITRVDLGSLGIRERLQSLRTLSEVSLHHPILPFKGVIDLVQWVNGETQIVDYKTGKPNESHNQQLLYYAVLWFRCTGELPGLLSVQYLSHRECIRPDDKTIQEVDLELEQAIARAQFSLRTHPGEASASGNCVYCPVRARCEPGWAHLQSKSSIQGGALRDIEVMVVGSPSATGFIGRKDDGKEIAITQDPADNILTWPLQDGMRIRLLNTKVRKAPDAIELSSWSEIYRV